MIPFHHYDNPGFFSEQVSKLITTQGMNVKSYYHNTLTTVFNEFNSDNESLVLLQVASKQDSYCPYCLVEIAKQSDIRLLGCLETSIEYNIYCDSVYKDHKISDITGHPNDILPCLSTIVDKSYNIIPTNTYQDILSQMNQSDRPGRAIGYIGPNQNISNPPLHLVDNNMSHCKQIYWLLCHSSNTNICSNIQLDCKQYYLIVVSHELSKHNEQHLPETASLNLIYKNLFQYIYLVTGIETSHLQYVPNIKQCTSLGNCNPMELLSKMELYTKPTSLGNLHSMVLNRVRDGNDIYQFHVGEPNYSIHPTIINQLTKITTTHSMGYSETAGLYGLREAIAQDMTERKSLTTSPEQIIITPGAKFSIYLIFQILCKLNDEVILPCPVWSTYTFLTKKAGAKPILVKMLPNGDLCLESIQAALSAHTRLLILCSPHNPTGTIPSVENLEQLALLLLKYPNVQVISDEIYERMDWSGKHRSFASIDKMRDRTITINGFSKSEGMTGLRVGYTIANESLIKQMIVLQAQSVSCSPTLSQWMAHATFKHTHDEGRFQIQTNRGLCIEHLVGLDYWNLDGGFYCFLNIKPLDDIRVVHDLLVYHRVSVAPGYLFELPGFIRISYATHPEILVKGLSIIRNYLESSRLAK